MGQSDARHSDDVAQPAELAMEEHGFDCWNPSPRSNFRMSHFVPSNELQEITGDVSCEKTPVA